MSCTSCHAQCLSVYEDYWMRLSTRKVRDILNANLYDDLQCRDMSNLYISEPRTTGKVVFHSKDYGDIEIELWAKEAPKTCRNFVQLCLEGQNQLLFTACSDAEFNAHVRFL